MRDEEEEETPKEETIEETPKEEEEEESVIESIPKRKKKKQPVRDEDEEEESPKVEVKEEEPVMESIPKRKKKKQPVREEEIVEETPKEAVEEESIIESIPKRKKKKQSVRDEEEVPKEDVKEEESVMESIPKRKKKKQPVRDEEEESPKEETVEETPKEAVEGESVMESIPKRKKKKHLVRDEEEESPKEEIEESVMESIPKRKKKKQSVREEEEEEEESAMEQIPKRKKKKHQSKSTIDEDSFYDSSVNKGQKVNKIKDDTMDDSDDSEEILNNDFDSHSERVDDNHSNDFKNQDFISSSVDYPSNSIWDRVKIVQTESPVQFLVSLVSQRITLTPQFNTSSYYYIYCTPQQHNEKVPDLDYLIALTFHSNLLLYSKQNPKLIILDSIELARVASVHCLVMSSYFEVYPPIKIDTPVDIVEEAPEIVISYKDRTTNSFLFSVNSTIPCYLWCRAFRQDTPPPSVIELMRKPKLFMRSFIELEETGLIPDVAYKLYCYAESVHGSPMNTPVEEKYTLFTTKEGIVIVYLFMLTYSFHAHFELDPDFIGAHLYSSLHS